MPWQRPGAAVASSLVALCLTTLSCAQRSTTAWSDVSAGLPSGFSVANLVSRGADAYAAVSSSASATTGLYLLAASSSTWTLYAPAVNKYGIGSLVVGPDSRLYGIHQGMLFVLNEAAAPRVWLRLASSLRNAGALAAGPSSSNKLYLQSNGTTNPVILEYDVSTGIMTNMQFPFTGLDGKRATMLATTQLY